MADLDDLRNYVKGDMAEVTLKTLKAFGIRSGAGLLAVLEDEKLIDDMAAKAISFEEFPAMEFDVLVGDETKQKVKKAHAEKSIRDAAKAATNGQKGLPLEGMLLTAAKQFGCQLSERLILDEALVQQLSQDIGAFKELYVCKATTDMPKTEQREDIEGKIVYTKRPRSGRLPVNY
ncbi:hypothetical protein FOZ60_006836 [Perkinsus olseni]|uniref:Uncharacterized protein n=1 Tax=Perkinsus olseni TaxID=32597 RepID=A0A7J6NNV9_PEROL|nr:hypothetical protein FOZ60_006836 [Perkinsus olseni]